MFESTLEAQGLSDESRRGSALSVALVAHLVAAGAAVVASVLIIPRVNPPPPEQIFFVTPEIPRDDGWKPDVPKPPAPPQGGGATQPVVVPPAPLLVPPDATPDTDLTTTEDRSDADSPIGLGPGAPIGVPGLPGSGPGSGSETGAGSGVGDGAPVFVTGNMVAPVLLEKIEPGYPDAARVARLPGKVVLQAIIGTDGRVESVEVVSSTNSLFDAAAADAVRKWRYRPASMGGRPVKVYFSVAVTFVLR
jgi:periplasmic protein TonB